MEKTSILFLDYRDSGQSESVISSWQSCFYHKGISACVDIGNLDNLKNDNGKYKIIILSSAALIRESELKFLIDEVHNGRSLLLSGNVGHDFGLHEVLREAAGVIHEGFIEDGSVPLVEKCIGVFGFRDALLFLEDKGPLPELKVRSARVLARSVKWYPEIEKYKACDFPTVVINDFGAGRIVYCAHALGDRNRIPLLRAGEAAPGWNRKHPHSVGYPDFSDLNYAENEFMFGLLGLFKQSLASVGHWSNGWRAVVSLTGDVHEDAQYVNIQAEAAVDIADFLDKEGLSGLFTFSVTGRAVEEHPDIMNRLLESGYKIVPHSAYFSTWLNEISLTDQTEEIYKCIKAFKKHLPDECLFGWRSHGWSGNKDTERLLAEQGVKWHANLIAQHYGDLGEMDVYLQNANGISFQCLPEKVKDLSILRFPLTLSPDWIRDNLGQVFYGLTEGPGADNSMVEFMKYKFGIDWRLEALHLVDWHPWEEFAAHPIFKKACRELVDIFRNTEHTAVADPNEIADWWNYRRKIEILEMKSGNGEILIKLFLPKNKLLMNPTIRLTHVEWQLKSVSIKAVSADSNKCSSCDWRFFGHSWVTLPIDIYGEIDVIIKEGITQDPRIVDSTAVIYSTIMDKGNMMIELEETRQRDGRVSIYLPKRSVVTVDDQQLETAVGYLTLAVKKGRRKISIKPINRRLSAEEIAGKTEP